MASAVQELQKSITSGSKSITQLLRETKVIAARLNLEDVEKWVDLELNGYGDVPPPEYRSYTCSHVEVFNPVRGWGFAGNQPRRFRADEPIAELEHLAEQDKLTMPIKKNLPTGDNFTQNWPQQFVISGAQFKHVIQAVRNKLLDWTIELERRGIKGDEFNESEQTAAAKPFSAMKDLKPKRIFIGHGGSPLWRELKDFLKDKLNLEHEEFNREPAAGKHTVERLEEMLQASCFAFLIMTAEDEDADGKMRARQNVVHELGLFQGKLGFKRAIVLREESCEEFSNIHGLTQIPFPKGRILAVSELVRDVLKREAIIT